jgi:hypothetical protein
MPTEAPTQPSLLDWRQPEKEVVPLKSWLKGRGWQTARQIAELEGWSDRECRAAAEASDGEIITGQKGYKLLAEATPEEVHHAAAWLESQGRKMIDRAVAIRRLYHRFGAAA